MSTTYTSRMIVGVEYNDLPEELKELEDNIYEFTDNNGLTVAFQWYDCGLDGLVLGKEIDNNISEENLDIWLLDVKQAFIEVKEILKLDSEVKLIATQDIY